MNSREVMQMALDALDFTDSEPGSIAWEREKEAIDAIKVALAEPQEPDWKALVLAHNAACDAGCDKEACGYAPYFAHSGRRCPTCPVYNKIELGIGGQDE